MSNTMHRYACEESAPLIEADPPTRQRARNPNALERGFTLIELMLVISILGLMSTIASPSFFSMKERARYANCVLKQRQIHEVAILYSAENNPGTLAVRIAVLHGADYISPSVGECPSSRIENFDDFEIQFTANEVGEIICDVMGADHLYTP